MIPPIRSGTLGFISAISRSILAIATLGLLGPEEERNNGAAGARIVSTNRHRDKQPPLSPVMRMVRMWYGADLGGLTAQPVATP